MAGFLSGFSIINWTPDFGLSCVFLVFGNGASASNGLPNRGLADEPPDFQAGARKAAGRRMALPMALGGAGGNKSVQGNCQDDHNITWMLLRPNTCQSLCNAAEQVTITAQYFASFGAISCVQDD